MLAEVSSRQRGRSASQDRVEEHHTMMSTRRASLLPFRSSAHRIQVSPSPRDGQGERVNASISRNYLHVMYKRWVRVRLTPPRASPWWRMTGSFARPGPPSMRSESKCPCVSSPVSPYVSSSIATLW